MKITMLEMANVKRIKALRMTPNENGLTIIGGRNGQGKTSVLDAIAYALGGEKKRPTRLKREDAVGEPFIHVETDDGYIIERKGKNSSLSITSADGAKGGQAILDEMLSKMAIDLPSFMNSSSRDKAKTLLQIIGVGDELAKLDQEEKAKFDTRHAVGRQADQKAKAAKDMPFYEDAPEEPLSVADLVKEQQDILGRNGVKEAARRRLDENKARVEELKRDLDNQKRIVAETERTINALNADIEKASFDDYDPEDTSEIEAKIRDFEAINEKVRANAERRRREEDADALKDEYETLTKELEDIRQKRLALLDGADLPLPGLSVNDGELTYDGKPWDCMSGSQQLIVACAIASALKPSCRFVLMDKLEQLDVVTLGEFGRWLEEHDLQCIATRVSTGGECSLVIEDGEASGEDRTIAWKPKDAEEDFEI